MSNGLVCSNIAEKHHSRLRCCSAVRQPVTPARPHATQPLSSTLQVSIALDRARHVRRMGQALQTLTAANVALRGAGLSAALEAQLHSYVHQLHACIDQMANIKEFRIPQASRRGRPCWRDKIVLF